MASVLWYFLVVAGFVAGASAHGRLLNPPSRSSLWRFKDEDPMLTPYADNIVENQDDDALDCGGWIVQHKQNDGKCGVCGDNWADPVKPNEAGGKYALGIITRIYTGGQVINVKVEITTPDKGYMEFRLCPWNNTTTPVTQECLNRRLLQLADGTTRWYLPADAAAATGVHEFEITLPNDVVCEQCVFQWKYTAGNTYSVDERGEGWGHGPQEEYYGCSDITILPVFTCKNKLSKIYFRTCKTFYHCVDGHDFPYIMDCAPNTVYDPNVGVCVHVSSAPPPCGTMDPNGKR